MGRMHAPTRLTPRLQRVLSAITFAGSDGITSLDLQVQSRTVAPGTCCSELRKLGYDIRCYPVGRVEDAVSFKYWLGRFAPARQTDEHYVDNGPTGREVQV